MVKFNISPGHKTSRFLRAIPKQKSKHINLTHSILIQSFYFPLISYLIMLHRLFSVYKGARHNTSDSPRQPKQLFTISNLGMYNPQFCITHTQSSLNSWGKSKITLIPKMPDMQDWHLKACLQLVLSFNSVKKTSWNKLYLFVISHPS